MTRFAAFAAAFALVSAGSAQTAPRRAAADEPEKPADPNGKMVCKRFVKIGSLVDSYRTCKTKAEWQRERDNARQFNVSDSCRQRAEGGSCE